MKPFLFLGVRPEDTPADDEYAAMLRCTGLDESTLRRVRLEAAPLGDVDLDAWSGIVLGGGPFCVSDAEEDKSAVQRRVEADLARLLDAGLRIGALSNARQDLQTVKLARAGLGDRLEVLVGVDTLGFGKPDPRVFLEACRRLGTAPARTAYVGDELDVDAVAARQAGLVGVWLDRPGPRRVVVDDAEVAAARATGVHVIASLDELPAALGVVR